MTPLRPLARAALGVALLLGLASAAPAQEQLGRLDVFVFAPDGHPAPGLLVEAMGRRAETGPDGVARLRLPAGQAQVTLRGPGLPLHVVTVPVVWGEVTEVIVRLTAGGAPPDVAVEAPGWPSPRSGGPLAEGPAGTLQGVVHDARQGNPVAGARVLVRGQPGEARTDAQGAFRLTLPAGTHTLSVIHPEFSTASLSDVVVPPAGTADVSLSLAPAGVQLETHTVAGYKLEGGLAALLTERRDERGVTEVIGAEQMSKSGDSDAAQALRRVTGLTVIGGRFVYIRGMGERYAGALLDGSTLPSPDPERRVVPLDLFPTDVIESITVQKTYSPELPGEFGAGVVRIRTKGIPDALTFGASVSTTYRENTTGKRGLTYKGGSTDWLGWDDETRNIPAGVRIAADREPLFLEDPISGEGYSAEVLEGLGEAMPNVWSTERRTIPADLGFSASLGDRYQALGTLGWRVGVSYDQAWQRRTGVRRVFGQGEDGQLVPVVDYRTEQLTRNVDISSLVGLGWEPAPGQELQFTTTWLRTTDDETAVYAGLLANEDTQIRVSSLNWVEEQLLSSQLRGKHALFADVTLAWSYTYSLATRWQPDWRRSRYDQEVSTGAYLLSNRPEGNQRLYNDLFDQNHDLSLSLDIPVPVWSELTAHVIGGAAFTRRSRESETRRFKFIHRGPRSQDPAVLALPAEQIFTPQNIGVDGFSFEEITRATDNYEATQTITAAFLNLQLPITATLDATLGARLERSRQEVSTFDLFSRGSTPQQADLDRTDLLPAASLVWRFHEAMQLRLAYGRTLTRPDFRELSTAPYDQVVGAGVFIGNPDLDRTRIDNLDLRWEWYLSADESISVGLFGKRLKDPIETVILGGSNRTLTLENADGGQNLGVELELRKRLGFLSPALEPLFLGGNFSWIHSEVELSRTGVATSRSRPLAGQSEYVVNLAGGWDDPETGTSLTLLYNVAGERLVGIGTFGLPDIYEQPVHRLDLVASWTFWDTWTIKAQLENLLDPQIRWTQSGRVVESYREGRSYGLSLSAKF